MEAALADPKQRVYHKLMDPTQQKRVQEREDHEGRKRAGLLGDGIAASGGDH
jgi:hypothetical protein